MRLNNVAAVVVENPRSRTKGCTWENVPLDENKAVKNTNTTTQNFDVRTASLKEIPGKAA